MHSELSSPNYTDFPYRVYYVNIDGIFMWIYEMGKGKLSL
jgi:hypothetical protein